MLMSPVGTVRQGCFGQVESPPRTPLRAPVSAASDHLTIRTSARPAIDLNFAAFLRGFQSGDKLRIDNGFFNPVGGSGKLHEVTSHTFKANLTVTLFGGPIANLNLDMVRVGDQYKMLAPEKWDLDVSQAGNTVTLRNKANHNQTISITSIGPAEMKVETKGLGQDGTLIIKKG